jgi:lysozyme
MDIFTQIRRDESCVLKPYKDTVGKLTIGIGRNLDDVGISMEEAEYLFHNDVAKVAQEITGKLLWAKSLDSVRYAVLLNMAFNMGVPMLLEFKKMLTAVKAQQWNEAAEEMLHSKWANQVGTRAIRLAEQMRSGVWQ